MGTKVKRFAWSMLCEVVGIWLLWMFFVCGNAALLFGIGWGVLWFLGVGE